MGNPVCLWQTELFKLNLKSSPSSSGYNRRRRLAPRSSRKQQAERTSVRAAPIVCPEESPLLATIGDNFAVSKSPLVGIDAPTPARGQGLQPYGALTLFFRWRKKSVQKKASGTATPEAARPASRRGLRPAVALRAVLVLGSLRSPAGKKPFIAHFAGGARNVARDIVGELSPSFVRAPVLAFFRRQNGRAFFPPLPIAALLPRSWRLASALLQVGMLRCGRKVLRRG